MTSSSPCPGVLLRRLPNGVPIIRVHYKSDPTMTPDRIATMRAHYTSDARWRRELEIEYEALEGERFYPEYSPELNDCDPFDLSDRSEWTLWMACDPHMRTPHGFLYWAVNPDGEHVICGELWPSQQFTVREYAETLKWLESDSDNKPFAWDWANGNVLHVHRRIMDTHGRAANSDEGVDYFAAYRGYEDAIGHPFTFSPAKKSEQALASSRDWIAELLLPEKLPDRSRPRLRVFRTCVETKDEFENVRFPSVEAVERPGQEKPETYQKHMLDCAAYIAGERPSFVLPQRPRSSWEPIYKSTGY